VKQEESRIKENIKQAKEVKMMKHIHDKSDQLSKIQTEIDTQSKRMKELLQMEQ